MNATTTEWLDAVGVCENKCSIFAEVLHAAGIPGKVCDADVIAVVYISVLDCEWAYLFDPLLMSVGELFGNMTVAHAICWAGNTLSLYSLVVGSHFVVIPFLEE